jgi:hypothetical protein
VDGPTTILLVLAAFPIFGLGFALVVAPARTTAALNEWYVVPPVVRSNQKVLLTLVRIGGLGLMVLAIGFGIRAIELAVNLST